MANAARQLSMHMIHPGPAHCKALGYMIEYLKGIEKKGIVIRSSRFLKLLCFVILITSQTRIQEIVSVV